MRTTRLYHKTTRNAVKALRNTSERNAAEALLPKVSAMLDKLAKHNIIHKNKAANLKSSLALHVNASKSGFSIEDAAGARSMIVCADAGSGQRGGLSQS